MYKTLGRITQQYSTWKCNIGKQEYITNPENDKSPLDRITWDMEIFTKASKPAWRKNNRSHAFTDKTDTVHLKLMQVVALPSPKKQSTLKLIV